MPDGPTDSVALVAAAVVELLDARPGRRIVGLAGPPGVGKSTFARRLCAGFGADAAYVPMDGFHLSNAQLARLGSRDRKGAPDTFDVDGYVATLRRLRAEYGEADVYVPDFDRAIEEPVAAGLVVPRDVRLVVTEGNYLALWDGARALLDRLYYLDCPRELRRLRLIRRHVAGGRGSEEAAAWVDVVDEPNAELIAATEGDCDATVHPAENW